MKGRHAVVVWLIKTDNYGFFDAGLIDSDDSTNILIPVGLYF